MPKAAMSQSNTASQVVAMFACQAELTDLTQSQS
jgi:hypothetical protein